MASSSAAIGLSHWSFSDRIASTLTGKSHVKDSANSTVPADVGTVEVAGRGGHCFTPLEQSSGARVAHHLLVSVLRLFNNLQRNLAEERRRIMLSEVASGFPIP